MYKSIIAILFFGIISISANAQYMRISNPDRTWQNTGVTLTENVYSVTDKGAYSEVNSYLSFKSDNPNEFAAGTQLSYMRISGSLKLTRLQTFGSG